MKNKKNIVLALVIVIMVAAVGFVIIVNNTNDSDSGSVTSTNHEQANFFTFDEKGVIDLYDVKTEAIIDTFDLKTLSENTTTNDNSSKQNSSTVGVKSQETSSTSAQTNLYKNFVKVSVIIKPGDNSWNIQKRLTPNHDIAEMLKLVAELNPGVRLHPIYAGEVRVFLKENDGEKVPTSISVTTPSVSGNTSSSNTPNVSTVFLYYKSEDCKTLYAFNPNNNSFDKIVISSNKIKASVLVTIPSMASFSDFKVIENQLYLLSSDGKVIKSISMTSPTTAVIYSLKDKVTNWLISGDNLFYTFSGSLGQYNTKTKTEKDVLIGDASLDMFVKDGEIYILNAFGKSLNNATLVKVNPSSLTVDGLVELKNNENIILSKSEDNALILGQVDRMTGVDGTRIMNQLLVPVNLKTMEKGEAVKKISYAFDNTGIPGYIYVLKDGKMVIYNTKGVQQRIITIKGTSFMPVLE